MLRKLAFFPEVKELYINLHWLQVLSSPSSVKSEDVASVPSHPLHRELCLILKEIKVGT